MARYRPPPPPDGGTISVRLTDDSGERTASTQPFTDALGEALAARGFTILDSPDHAANVAEVTVTRQDVGIAKEKAPTGGAAVLPSVSAGAGAGVVMPLSPGRSSLAPLQRTVLDLRIRRRGDASVGWHGAAVTVRPSGTEKKVAADLSVAVLRSYPMEPADMVGVP